MARRAGGGRRRHVRSYQGKSGHAVIEGSGVPARGGMTSGAIGCGESRSGGGVHGIVGPLPGAQMALRIAAIRRRDRQRIIIVNMAESAGHSRVPICQREAGGIVIEDSCGPGGDRVASCARGSCRGESSRDVIRNIPSNRGGALECGRVTSVAIRRAKRVVIAYVAGSASRRGRR